MVIDIYGIPNCDTIRKVRRWLSSAGLDYTFHDYRREGVDKRLLALWQQNSWGGSSSSIVVEPAGAN
ncbi:MAG: hypothetical protein Q9M13_07110 [Mariprofundales bacterium]|nr:hypothetical protein [Mariprofundales bacterium]